MAPLPVRVTLTSPPPDWPVTVAVSSLVCMSAILDCMTWTCFIMSPRFFITLFHWFQGFGIAHISHCAAGKALEDGLHGRLLAGLAESRFLGVFFLEGER